MSTKGGFSIAVSGKGMLMGMFITDGIQRWGKEATFYDHSDAVKAFREGEAKLGESGLGDKGSQELAKKIRAHDANPPKIDVQVKFATFGDKEIAIISGNGRQRVVELNKKKVDWQGVEHALEECFKAVDEIMGRKPQRPKFIKRPGPQPGAGAPVS